MKEYEISNEIALKNAIFSLNTEGYTVNEDCIANCKKLLNNEITFDEYLKEVLRRQGLTE